jgi:formylglycine-generating enzyme required for sulfatase activity
MGENTSVNCCGTRRAQLVDSQTGNNFAARALNIEPASPEVTEKLRAALVEIPSGFFDMGTRKSRFPEDLDSPRQKVFVSKFLFSPTAVTNAQFARFVAETNYQTVAEQEGWSYVFDLQLKKPLDWPDNPIGLPWWRGVTGASWNAPAGPGSSWESQPDHPVVHIAWYDADAYCRWAGLRLPREAEWERAARGGLAHKKFPWGNSFNPNGAEAMNTWCGDFPSYSSRPEGYVGTVPVNAFEPNGYGIFNTTGNVWEWVSNFAGQRPKPSENPERDPTGPVSGYARMQKGGSFLCHDSYCNRYHVHSRTSNDPDSTTSNCGFRVAASL